MTYFIAVCLQISINKIYSLQNSVSYNYSLLFLCGQKLTVFAAVFIISSVSI